MMATREVRYHVRTRSDFRPLTWGRNRGAWALGIEVASWSDGLRLSPLVKYRGEIITSGACYIDVPARDVPALTAALAAAVREG